MEHIDVAKGIFFSCRIKGAAEKTKNMHNNQYRNQKRLGKQMSNSDKRKRPRAMIKIMMANRF
jgi:hypothetical protein